MLSLAKLATTTWATLGHEAVTENMESVPIVESVEEVAIEHGPIV